MNKTFNVILKKEFVEGIEKIESFYYSLKDNSYFHQLLTRFESIISNIQHFPYLYPKLQGYELLGK